MYFYLGKFVGTHLEMLIHVWRETDAYFDQEASDLLFNVFFPLTRSRDQEKGAPA